MFPKGVFFNECMPKGYFPICSLNPKNALLFEPKVCFYWFGGWYKRERMLEDGTRVAMLGDGTRVAMLGFGLLKFDFFL